MALPIQLLDYALPEHQIAQHPLERRDHSKLMVVDRASGRVSHHRFYELPALLPPDTALFFNDVAVLKARLPGQRPTGGKVECLLLTPESPNRWQCLLKPGRRLGAGATFGFKGHYNAKICDTLADGVKIVEFTLNSCDNVIDLAEALGQVPLPPYIHRDSDPATNQADAVTYQTVYANPAHRQAVAAPTAGLHFTPEVLSALDKRGFARHHLTLNVGLGTFRPIQCDNVLEHPMHAESYTLPDEVRRAHRESARRMAVGTTTLRALEDYTRQNGPSLPDGPYQGMAQLFIHPPQNIQSAEILLTNFHLPRSTLLCLVAAFLRPGEETAGITLLLDLYRQAIDNDYRFFSYGDAMLIC